MSETLRRTRTVFAIFTKLTGEGDGIRPGAVNDHLRERGLPMGTWEVRGEFSKLVDMGLIRLDDETGIYHPIEGAAWPQDRLSEAG